MKMVYKLDIIYVCIISPMEITKRMKMIESTKKIRYKLRYTLIIFPIIIISIVYYNNELLLSIIFLPF